jgi:hypothetical protein
MAERYIPVDPDGSSREPQADAAFMMRCLLSSDPDDEAEHDVNVYLTQLLCSYGDPRYCLRVGGYISTYDSTVFERAQQSPSHRFRYTVYTVNADHLLMSVGVFQNPEGRPTDGRSPAMRRSDETFVGRGKTYYDFASTCSQRVFGRTSGVTDVLGKLSAGFERYLRLLTHLRSEYFDLVARISDGEIFHLQVSAQNEGVQALRDEFLDRYSAYKRDGSPEARAALLEVAERLKRVDPGFNFGPLQ